MESNSADDSGDRSDLVEQDGGGRRKVSYFKKICLQAPACEKAWIFERVPGYELAGYDNRVTANVPSRLRCQEICLEADDLPCRSAEYVYATRTCRLSTETRRSQPAAYR